MVIAAVFPLHRKPLLLLSVDHLRRALHKMLGLMQEKKESEKAKILMTMHRIDSSVKESQLSHNYRAVS